MRIDKKMGVYEEEKWVRKLLVFYFLLLGFCSNI